MGVADEVFDVRGKVALVTGGASGLGNAFSSILADAGANLVVADVDPAASRTRSRRCPPTGRRSAASSST